MIMTECPNCHDHFEQFKPSIKEVIITKHFKRDFPDFDTDLILDSKHEHFTRLHKYEENIEGNHIFRALKDKIHIVYAIDKSHNLIFLRVFHNFKEYMKFLDNKKIILKMIKSI